MIFVVTVLSIFSVVVVVAELQFEGECATLRTELESSDNSTIKLEKFNAFLDTLGSTTKQDFWDLIDEAKADAEKNLPSDAAKKLATQLIADFSNGQLFLPQAQVTASLKEQFAELSDTDQTVVRKFAKNYGKEIKSLIFPLLPASCVSGTQQIAADSTQKGFNDPDTDTISRRKRHVAFFENIAAAYRQLHRDKFHN